MFVHNTYWYIDSIIDRVCDNRDGRNYKTYMTRESNR